MELLYSVVIAVLVGCGMYLFLQKTMIRLILGAIILSNAANLIILTAAGLKSRKAPIIDPANGSLTGFEADPLPQALILTAIVIGFAVIAFLLVLSRELYRAKGTQGLSKMRDTE
ncbi:cation:proton antiporter [bacterium]|nr:cation:proton antiporter [bacterium]